MSNKEKITTQSSKLKVKYTDQIRKRYHGTPSYFPVLFLFSFFCFLSSCYFCFFYFVFEIKNICSDTHSTMWVGEWFLKNSTRPISRNKTTFFWSNYCKILLFIFRKLYFSRTENSLYIWLYKRTFKSIYILIIMAKILKKVTLSIIASSI